MARDAHGPDRHAAAVRLTRGEIFSIFLKAGWGFGGGLGILAVLEDELVSKRRAVTRDDFLTNYGMARIVPSGTMTALAVAYGYRFGGMVGTVVALTGLALPGLALTIALTIGYDLLRSSPLFDLLPITIMPAAVALIVVAALKLGKDVFRPSRELAVAAAAFALSLVARVNPALLLMAGGVLGIFVFRSSAARNRANDEQSRA